MVEAYNHTYHTELRNKHIAHKGLIGLCSKLFVEVRHHNMVDACNKQVGDTLTYRCKQLHTRGLAQCYTRMRVEGNDNTLGIEARGHSLEVCYNRAMATVYTIKRADGNDRATRWSDIEVVV